MSGRGVDSEMALRGVRIVDFGQGAIDPIATSYLADFGAEVIKVESHSNLDFIRRGETFVTRKITSHAAKIRLGMENVLTLGNLDARRDWGHSREYVQQMYAMLQMDKPEDLVIATGETHTVKEFCELAFSELGLNWEDHVRVDERFRRPSEVELLVGDASRAKEKLGWEPKILFKDLVKEMVLADYEMLKKKTGEEGGNI